MPLYEGLPLYTARAKAKTDHELHFGGFVRVHDGHFLIRLSENGHLRNGYAPENFEHMAEKISPRYVEIRGLFGFRCT